MPEGKKVIGTVYIHVMHTSSSLKLEAMLEAV